jgi:hypothetical protein
MRVGRTVRTIGVGVSLLERGVNEASRIRLVKEVREVNIASGEMYQGNTGLEKGGIDEDICGQKFGSATNAATSVDLKDCRKEQIHPRTNWGRLAPFHRSTKTQAPGVIAGMNTPLPQILISSLNSMTESSETQSRCLHPQ